MEHGPVHQKVAGSIHSQGTCPGYKSNPKSGHVQEATNVSLSLSLSPPPSPSLSLPPSFPFSLYNQYIYIFQWGFKKKNQEYIEKDFLTFADCLTDLFWVINTLLSLLANPSVNSTFGGHYFSLSIPFLLTYDFNPT